MVVNVTPTRRVEVVSVKTKPHLDVQEHVDRNHPLVVDAAVVTMPTVSLEDASVTPAIFPETALFQ